MKQNGQPKPKAGTPKGNGMAFPQYRSLRDRYLPIIRNHVLSNSGSTEDAEDIFQDASIIFLRRMRNPKFQLQCSPGTFLFSIARNLWHKRLRRKLRRQRYIQQEQHTALQEPEFTYEELALEKQQLQAAFRKLSCPCRRLLNFFYFHKMRYDEISEVMGISTPQVAKNQKLRCMQRLRKLLIKK